METNKYNHFKATMALAKASLRSIMRSPSAVVFSIMFPLIFIVVFGFIGGGGITINLGVSPKSDVQNPVIHALEATKMVHIIKNDDEQKLQKALEKGQIDGLINVQHNPDGAPAFTTNIQYTKASMDKGNILKSFMTNLVYTLNTQNVKPSVTEIKETTVQGRAYQTIDFILPGQLGFSLLSTGVFGTAFVFLSLRLTLVIKRFFATPVRRSSIVLGEALARLTFALIGALIIILLGHFAFGFTLIKGPVTVINMLLLSTLGVIVFMGFGFVVSGIAKSESSVPPIANIITLPQFLLSGTFFSIDVFPTWLQPISRSLPLTYLNDALRQVAFEGAGLWDVKHQIMILFIWGIAIYAVAVKVFKWE